jgi:protein-S-isoprenylcysteine O-methyltransferase Ste14
LSRDFAARTSVGALFVLLSMNVLADFRHTHHLTGLLLLASEGLVVVLTIVRRPTTMVDRSTLARVTAVVSTFGPPFLRIGGAPSLLPDAVTAAVSAAGLCLVITGKLTLGRSFGIVAANRGVVDGGPYILVRHPIYTGYLITHVAFLFAHPSATNIALVIAADTALIVRALVEERTLVLDERYRTYCSRVAWHFVPGVF